MMPDLGKYAVEVTSAYVASLVLIGVFVALSWVRSRRVKARLAAMEARR